MDVVAVVLSGSLHHRWDGDVPLAAGDVAVLRAGSGSTHDEVAGDDGAGSCSATCAAPTPPPPRPTVHRAAPGGWTGRPDARLWVGRVTAGDSVPAGLLVLRGADRVVVEEQPGRVVDQAGMALGLAAGRRPARLGRTERDRSREQSGGMPTSAADLLSAAYNDADRTIDLRRRLHRHPEIGLHLPRTQDLVLEAFADLPIEVTTGKSTSSVVGVLRGARPGPTYLLRGDMDALPVHEDTGLPFASEVPGAMHACGHDTHVAMLLGAARLLAERRDELAGQVVFMVQPGEEGFHGARFMLEEGLLDVVPEAPVSGAFALHISSTMTSGSVNVRPGADDGGRGPVAAGRPRAGWARLRAAHRRRPDPGGGRDRAGAAGDGDPPGGRVRPRGGHRGPHRGRLHQQRHPADRVPRGHDPHPVGRAAGRRRRRGPAGGDACRGGPRADGRVRARRGVPGDGERRGRGAAVLDAAAELLGQPARR